METKPPIPRAILVGVQLPGVDDLAHAADIEELGRLVKTLGYEVVDTISQKRDEIGGGTVLGKGHGPDGLAAAIPCNRNFSERNWPNGCRHHKYRATTTRDDGVSDRQRMGDVRTLPFV